jgi:hypothetical protein
VEKHPKRAFVNFIDYYKNGFLSNIGLLGSKDYRKTGKYIKVLP